MEDEIEPEEPVIRKEDFKLSLDYKSQSIVGLNGRRLTGFMISFYFERKGSSWKMTNLEVVNIPFDGEFLSLEMGSKTASGDKVECPIGLSFSCSDGIFKSNSSASGWGSSSHSASLSSAPGASACSPALKPWIGLMTLKGKLFISHSRQIRDLESEQQFLLFG